MPLNVIETERSPGAYVCNGILFFKLLDGSVLTCNCIKEPYVSQVVRLFQQAFTMTDAVEEIERMRAEHNKLLQGFAYLKDESAKEIDELRTDNEKLRRSNRELTYLLAKARNKR